MIHPVSLDGPVGILERPAEEASRTITAATRRLTQAGGCSSNDGIEANQPVTAAYLPEQALKLFRL